MICQSLAAHEPPQLPCLHLQHPAIRHFVTELRVAHLRVQPAKPSFPKWPPSAVVQKSPARAADEIFRAKFAAIDEADRHAVGDERTKFLHQIQCQGRAAIAWLVHETKKWIKPDRIADAPRVF